MQCPIDERVLLDFLEEELDGQPAAEVAEHLASCAVCSRELGRLRSMRRAVRDKAASYQPPDEDFWRRNLEAVGSATWQKGKPGGVFSLRKLNRLLPALAAAAVVVLALMGTFRMNAPDAPEMTAYTEVEDSIDASALVDTLYMLAELARQYEMSYSTMESIEQLGNESGAYDETGMTYPVTNNVYGALLDMDDDQLDQVLMVLASN